MQSLEICWAFILDYDRDMNQINVEFSNQFMEDHNFLNKQISFVNDEICTFLHRYDCRKLGYFCKTGMKDTFDTLMRFTIKKSKYPLRTIAICKLNDHGMSCINFEESKMVNFKSFEENKHLNSITQLIDVINSNDLSKTYKKTFSQVDQYLTRVLERSNALV